MSGAAWLLIVFAFVYVGSYLALFSHVSRQIEDRGLGGLWYVFAVVHPLWALMLMPADDEY